MPLDPDACFRAVARRDRRHDGRFFTGVVTTGIYCRPVCPSRTPLRRNVVFFPSAAAAAEAGFRACRRCRPDAPPGSPAWRGTGASVARALRLIEQGALDRGSVADLAARLGLGERQLRRLFERHLGESPVAVAQRRRALRARRLLLDTALPITEVAHAAGFASLRRFNAAMREAWGEAPRALRARGARSRRGEAPCPAASAKPVARRSGGYTRPGP
jgi:AraC family transcriptional regulator of adaptative response / DNA-3-methyladenine glycosylase II